LTARCLSLQIIK